MFHNHYVSALHSVKHSRKLCKLSTKTFTVDAIQWTFHKRPFAFGQQVVHHQHVLAIHLTSLEVILLTRGMFDTLEIWIYLSEGHKQRKPGAEKKAPEQKIESYTFVFLSRHVRRRRKVTFVWSCIMCLRHKRKIFAYQFSKITR